MKDRRVVYCARASDLEPVDLYPGSVKRECERCQAAVWISPGTLVAVEKLNSEIVCSRCLGPVSLLDVLECETIPPDMPEEFMQERRDVLNRYTI